MPKNKQGIESWGYVPFSEPRIVETLILQRNEQDRNYDQASNQTSGGLIWGAETSTMDLDRILTFITLDQLISSCGLEENEEKVIKQLMDGYSYNGAGKELGVSAKVAYSSFKRGVKKIVDENNRRTEKVFGKKLGS